MSALTFGPIHDTFLADETSQIDLEGARYSGKTWVCCAKILRSCVTYPGIRWLACRYSNEETKTKIKPVLQDIARRMGIELDWNDDEKAYHLPEVSGLVSKIFCHGLKAQSRLEELAKVRGLDMGGIWNDQSEEAPQMVAEELPFGTRQAGYPHQLIFSPNPPSEDHFLADMFPEECTYLVEASARPFLHRVYYRLSLYDNPHCPPDKIRELETTFPPTHAKHKSLILGLRGPNVTGTPIYDGIFGRDMHYNGALTYDPSKPLLEAYDAGKHHPSYIAAQRTHFGGLHLLGGIIGKRLFLEDFIPVLLEKRAEWFGERFAKDKKLDKDTVLSCCDDPRTSSIGSRITSTDIIRQNGIKLRWQDNSNAPDVREAVIQNVGSMMLRRTTAGQMFRINADPTRWIMASHSIVKQSRLFVDALEGSYVWDKNYVSVANKTVRQPQFDEWLDGQQRCLENLVLNFCAGRKTGAEKEAEAVAARVKTNQVLGGAQIRHSNPDSWMV